MKLYLDECIDRGLARHFVGHEVRTARQMRWTSVQNGALLSRAAAQFDVFITVDRNLAFQQNLATLPIPVVVLRARTNRLADLVPLVPATLARLTAALPKAIIVIGEENSI